MICDLCKKEINTEIEKYVHIEDWEWMKIVKEMWCHNKCFNKAMNKNLTKLEKQAGDMLGKAGQIFDSEQFKEMFPKKDEVYQI